MRRMAFAVVALVGCCAGTGRADTLPMLTGVPDTYTPGQSFTFQVLVPNLVDFSSYQVDLIFQTTVPNPPLFASATAGNATGGQYVFPSTANFQSGEGLVLDSPNVTLTFLDPTTSHVNTASGVNDTLATVTVHPGADLTGPITISIGNETNFNYNTELGSFPGPDSITVQQADVSAGNPVPAPPGAVLLSIGGLLFGIRSRFRKPVATSDQ